MKGFFKIEEIKVFSLEEKVIWILDRIISSFSIEKTKKETIRYWDKVAHKYCSYSVTYSSIPLNFEKISQLEIPFDNITLRIDGKQLHIAGKDFSYLLSIDMILTMRKRWNKIKPKIK